MEKSDAPLRIAFVVECFSGGTGRHVVDLTSGLCRRGHTVHLIYSDLREDWNPELLERCDGAVHRHQLPMLYGVSPRDIATAPALYRALRRIGPLDIVHGHGSKGGAMARLVGAVLGATRVYTPHGLQSLNATWAPWKRHLVDTAERTLTRLTDALILVSTLEYTHALSLGLPADKVHYVPNGCRAVADPVGTRRALRARLGLGAEDVCIGFVGRMIPNKNPLDLVRLFLTLAVHNPRLHLAMVGTGPLLEEAQRMAEANPAGVRVHWLGETDGAAAMAGFDLFALPSHKEGFPYVLLEALNAGLPIVTFDVGGAQEGVVPQRNGWILAHGDEAGFAVCLAELARNRTLRAAFAAESRRRALAFTVEAMTTRTEGVYRHAQRAHRSGFPTPSRRAERENKLAS